MPLENFNLRWHLDPSFDRWQCQQLRHIREQTREQAHLFKTACASNAISPAEALSFFKNFKIDPVIRKRGSLEVDVAPLLSDDFEISLLRPISAKSAIDSQYRISAVVSTVTVICHGGDSSCSSGISSGNHTMLVIEEMVEGNYSMKLAHFGISRDTGVEAIEIIPLAPGRLKYIERTKVWEVSSAKVKKMFADIVQDSRNPPKLSTLGRDSWFSGGNDSCFTWVREKLRVHCDIDLGTSLIGSLFTRSRNFTNSEKTHKDHFYRLGLTKDKYDADQQYEWRDFFPTIEWFRIVFKSIFTLTDISKEDEEWMRERKLREKSLVLAACNATFLKP